MRSTKNVDNTVGRINLPILGELDLALGWRQFNMAEFISVPTIID